jgi:2-phospho-L-lactate guanylyltransferase (CobY/MobA/RfbA family)
MYFNANLHPRIVPYMYILYKHNSATLKLKTKETKKYLHRDVDDDDDLVEFCQYGTHHSYVLLVHTLRVAENEILKLDFPAKRH